MRGVGGKSGDPNGQRTEEGSCIDKGGPALRRESSLDSRWKNYSAQMSNYSYEDEASIASNLKRAMRKGSHQSWLSDESVEDMDCTDSPNSASGLRDNQPPSPSMRKLRPSTAGSIRELLLKRQNRRSAEAEENDSTAGSRSQRSQKTCQRLNKELATKQQQLLSLKKSVKQHRRENDVRKLAEIKAEATRTIGSLLAPCWLSIATVISGSVLGG